MTLVDFQFIGRYSGTCFAYRLHSLTLHVVIMGSIPSGSSHGEVRLLIDPGDVLKSGPKARRILRSGLSLDGMEQTTVFLGCFSAGNISPGILPLQCFDEGQTHDKVDIGRTLLELGKNLACVAL